MRHLLAGIILFMVCIYGLAIGLSYWTGIGTSSTGRPCLTYLTSGHVKGCR